MMKRVPLVVAAIVLMASGMTSASASHPTWICIDSGPDSHYAVSNDDLVDKLTITVGASDDGHPPETDGCATSQDGNAEGARIYVEVTGASDQDGDTPASPDLSCTPPPNSNRCDVQPPPSGGGTQTLRAWMDFGEGTQIDRTEGHDEDTSPGEMGEPDGTDVSEWTWTHGDPPPPCVGDCSYETNVSLRYERDDDRFHGRVTSPREACVRRRSIELRRVRKGRNELVANPTTGRNGRWAVPDAGVPPGTYYVTVSPVTLSDGALCEKGRSDPLRI